MLSKGFCLRINNPGESYFLNKSQLPPAEFGSIGRAS